MNLDQIEDLLRRYLSAGIAVVVVLVSPVTGATPAPGTAETGTTRAGAPDGQVDILDGTPPDARSGDDTGSTTPAAPTTGPDGIEPDPVPDTPGPEAPANDDSADDDSADGTGSEDTGTAGPEAGTDTEADEPRSTEPDADDLADRGPADRDEPGVSDDGPRPSAGAPDTGGAGDRPGSDTSSDTSSGNDGHGNDGTGSTPAEGGTGPSSTDRDTSPTTTPRPTDADDPTGGDGDGGAGDDEETGAPGSPGSAVPTTGAGPADGDSPTGTDATPDSTPTAGASPGAAEAGAAAERYGWGAPVQSEDFTSARLTGWTPYEGTGYDGRGRRSPDAISVRDGILTITGDERGTTGGLCWGGGQRYGRWEARLRAPASDVSYNALLLLWPDADDAPTGGEIDFVEMADPARRSAEFFLHFGEDDDQIRSRVQVDGTDWHDWAVEWTPERIVGYVDGEEWFSSTDPATFPPGPMHLCIQLDWFPQGTGEVRESRMEVDRVRQYALDRTAGGGGLLDRMLSWS